METLEIVGLAAGTSGLMQVGKALIDYWMGKTAHIRAEERRAEELHRMKKETEAEAVRRARVGEAVTLVGELDDRTRKHELRISALETGVSQLLEGQKAAASAADRQTAMLEQLVARAR